MSEEPSAEVSANPNDMTVSAQATVNQPTEPAPSSRIAEVEAWLAAHVYTSPHYAPTNTTNPFLAGFNEAVNHIRMVLLHNPPPTSSAQ